MHPRSTPYKPPPPAPPAVPDSFRRWAVCLAVVTVSTIAVLVGLGVLGVYLVVRANRPAVAGTPSPAAAPLSRDSRPASDGPRDSQPVGPAATETKSPEPRPPVPRDRLLDSLGTLTGAHLYQSYLNIGLLADAAENGVYTDEEAQRLLEKITEFLDTVDQQLARLADAGLEAEDKDHIQRCRQVAERLRTQARALRAYWDTPEKDAAARKEQEAKYHKARDEAWAGVKGLLGLKE